MHCLLSYLIILSTPCQCNDCRQLTSEPEKKQSVEYNDVFTVSVASAFEITAGKTLIVSNTALRFSNTFATIRVHCDWNFNFQWLQDFVSFFQAERQKEYKRSKLVIG